jgi:hypothetical protein
MCVDERLIVFVKLILSINYFIIYIQNMLQTFYVGKTKRKFKAKRESEYGMYGEYLTFLYFCVFCLGR